MNIRLKIIPLSLLVWIGFTSSALAVQPLQQPLEEIETQKQLALKQFELPPPPPTGTPSGRPRGGGSRGNCQIEQNVQSLTVLMPVSVPEDSVESEQNEELRNVEAPNLKYVWSYTTEGHPTFWFYVPYTLTEPTEILFILQDDDGNTLEPYTQSFEQTLDAGIVSVQLPLSAPELSLDKGYRWFFQIYCDGENPDFVEGWVYRIEPEEAFLRQIQSASSQEQARLYAEQGIWQDALTLLAELIQAEDVRTEIFEDWQNLLDSVELGLISEQPFTECCLSENLNE